MDCTHIEPSLAETLADPIVLMMMEADHVDRTALLNDLGVYGPGNVPTESPLPLRQFHRFADEF